MNKNDVEATIALGANLGNAQATLKQAIAAIGRLPGTRVLRQSSFYKTAPVESSGPDYINAVIQVQTSLPAFSLLESLQGIENAYGRVRPAGVINAPRTLDLDVLLYGDVISGDSRLTLPHPRMHLRAFVLVPLAEIDPYCAIPGQKPLAALLKTVTDQKIEKI